MMRVNVPETVAEVTAAFNAYERALMANDPALDIITRSGVVWT